MALVLFVLAAVALRPMASANAGDPCLDVLASGHEAMGKAAAIDSHPYAPRALLVSQRRTEALGTRLSAGGPSV